MTRTLLASMMIFAMPSLAAAHGMNVNYSVSATTVRVIVAYDDDSPVEEGNVRIVTLDGQELAKAKTDAHGVAELPRPAPGTYKLKADDGGGHAKTKTLEIPADANVGMTTSDTPNRWLMIATGLGIIALLSFLLKRFKRRPA